MSTPDPWEAARRFTQARVALGRAGGSLPTAEVLRFSLAHALARDAVHRPLDDAALAEELIEAGFDVVHADSRATDRQTYLMRPDLGRRLSPQSLSALARLVGDGDSGARADAVGPVCAAGSVDAGERHFDLAFVVADGLSSLAVQRHAAGLLRTTRPLLPVDWRLAPVTIVRQGRVAIGDEIAQTLGARLVAVLIGERPGLSSPDSLGVYLTWQPRVGMADSQRNCLSNIRPEGLPCEAAARRLAWLLTQAAGRGLTGIGLKDDSAPGLPSPAPGLSSPEQGPSSRAQDGPS